MSIFIGFYILELLISFFRACLTDYIDIVILSYYKPLVWEEMDDFVEKCGEDKLKGKNKSKGKIKAVEYRSSKLDSNLSIFNRRVTNTNI